MSLPSGSAPSAPARRARSGVFLVGFCVCYGLLLLLAWGIRMARARPELAPDAATVRQMRQRSESVCRLFNAPLPSGPSGEWPVSATAAARGGPVGYPLWSVDCTGPVGTQGRGQGAFVLWDARTGELYSLSNGALDIYPAPVPPSPVASPAKPVPPRVRNAGDAARISGEWLIRLRVQDAADPWTRERVERGPASWTVTWRRRGQTCTVRIAARTGDLARFQRRDTPPSSP